MSASKRARSASKGFERSLLALFEVAHFRSTEGAATSQPRAKRSAALGLIGPQSPSPERAKQRATVAPFQGSDALCSLVPGRRFALPWAVMFRPLRGTKMRNLKKLKQGRVFRPCLRCGLVNQGLKPRPARCSSSRLDPNRQAADVRLARCTARCRAHRAQSWEPRGRSCSVDQASARRSWRRRPS